MVKMVKIFAAVALVLCASASAYAENFVEIDRTDRGATYIDTDSITDGGSYVTAVSKIEMTSKEARDEFKEKSGVEADALYLTFAYNKEAKQDQFLAVRTMSGTKETSSDSRDFAEENWRDIPDGSLGEKTREWLLDYTAKQK